MSRGSLDLFAGRLEHFADRVRALADRDGISAGERAALLGVAADAEALAPRANAVEYWCDSKVPEHLLGVEGAMDGDDPAGLSHIGACR